MRYLFPHDIENMKLRAGYGTGDVVLTRDEFESLIAGYLSSYTSLDDLNSRAANTFKEGEKVRKLQDQVSELTKQLHPDRLFND